MPALAINDVALRLGPNDVLKGVSLAVPEGKVAALLGPAGSGKTALLRTVAGLEVPHAGTIRVGDKTVFDAAAGIEVPPDKRGVGLMFKSGALWPNMSVRDNLAFAARFRTDAADARARANRMLVQFNLAGLVDRLPGQLSAIDRLRVAVLRALIAEPKLLLLDEPLAHHEDAEASAWLRQAIANAGVTTLFATRDRFEAFALAEHVAVIHAGAIDQEGAPNDIFAKPATPVVAGLMGACNRIEGPLVEKAGLRAFIDVMGARIGGINCTQAALGETCTGVIRIERVLIGGGPGVSRLRMKLAAQTYLGERWEVTFVKDSLTVRAHASAPLRHELYHVEFPPDALWIY